ncbi:hypothetical protein [Methanobrevibacter sp.]|uniref:hypothetical protein n=1 Tax=Methanobrevibacter sp. TaxID=66852 RepID=UPI003864B3E4
MKLKNSHILLIVIAIFLLISIGSVCASDISSADDAVLAEDGSNVVLANETTTADTTKLDTKVVSDNVKVSEKDKKIPVAVNDNESNPIEVGAKNLTVTEGNTTLKFSYNQSKITITTNLNPGTHNLILTYLGNNVYNKSSTNIVLSVFGDFKIEAPTSVNVNQTNKAEVPVTITNGIDVKTVTASEFEVEVSYKNGNNTTKIDVSDLAYANGKLVFTRQFVENVTSYNMTITYKGSDNKTLTHKGKLNKITTIKIIPLNTETDYQAGNFTFQIVDSYTNETLANQKVSLSGTYNGTSIYWDIKQSGNSISLSTSKSLTSDSNGIITIDNINFYPGLMLGSTNIYAPAGVYNLTITGSGVASGSLKTTAKINKIKSKITVEKFSEYIGSDKKLKIVVVNAETGKPISGATIFFNLTNSDGKEIVFTSQGANNTTVKVNHLTTNDNGAAEIPMNLVVGKYSIYADVSTSSNYATSKVSSTATIKGIPLKYTVSSTGVVTVTNKLTNKPEAGVFVLLKFDGSDNKRILTQTNKNGKVEIKTVGKHKIQVTNADSRYTASAVTKTITNKKITAKCSAPKVTDYYKGVKVFTVKLTTSAKKPIYDAKITLLINGYKQSVRTGVDGQIRLSLNTLKPGTYKVVVKSGDTKSFTIKQISTKIVIKKAPAKLTPKKLTAKKGVKKYFKVTVKNTKTKKVIKGVKVKIKVYTGKKYKTYSVKTNSKGIANLNVKSLKVGSHKVVVSSANKYVVAKAAKSTIKITK